jgi:hypothetical protein
MGGTEAITFAFALNKNWAVPLRDSLFPKNEPLVEHRSGA